MENKLIKNKVALVSGAERGVGRDIALMIAEHGARVIVNDMGKGNDGEGLDGSPAHTVTEEIQAADDATDISGLIIAVRSNEIFLKGQSRPLRGMQRSESWAAETAFNHAFLPVKASFYGLDRTSDVFTWEPV